MTAPDFRAIEAGRAAWGAALLAAPRAVLRNVHHLDADTTTLVVARILGARQLGQAALSGIRPSPEVLAIGVWVDTAHALSAAGLALADRSRDRAGLTDTAVAAAWAVLGYRDLRRAAASPLRHDRRRDRLARTALRFAPGGGLLLRQVRADRHPARDG